MKITFIDNKSKLEAGQIYKTYVGYRLVCYNYPTSKYFCIDLVDFLKIQEYFVDIKEFMDIYQDAILMDSELILKPKIC